MVSAGRAVELHDAKRLQWVAKTSPVLKDVLPPSWRSRANGSQPAVSADPLPSSLEYVLKLIKVFVFSARRAWSCSSCSHIFMNKWRCCLRGGGRGCLIKTVVKARGGRTVAQSGRVLQTRMRLLVTNELNFISSFVLSPSLLACVRLSPLSSSSSSTEMSGTS